MRNRSIVVRVVRIAPIACYFSINDFAPGIASGGMHVSAIVRVMFSLVAILFLASQSGADNPFVRRSRNRRCGTSKRISKRTWGTDRRVGLAEADNEAIRNGY